MQKFIVVIFALLILFISTSTAQTATQPPGLGTSGDPYLVMTLDHLYWITQNSGEWGAYFLQMANIDASATALWDDGDGGDPEGFSPIGNTSTRFTGSYDGNGFYISNLFIDRPSTDRVGFFGYAFLDKPIQNISLVNVNITGHDYVGGLLGHCWFSFISILNCSVTGDITVNRHYAGGLIGYYFYGTVEKSFSTASVTNTSAGNYNGGLIGYNDGATVSNCYSTGSVSGNEYSGGFIGRNSGGTVSNCYSSGEVSFSTQPRVGGFIGNSTGTVSDCFWDIESSKKTSSDGGTGKTSLQMTQQATFTNWDFSTVWGIDEGTGYPYLTSNEQIPHPTPPEPPNIFAGGDGTEADPYQIATAVQLDSVRYFPYKFFIQTADIDLDVSPFNSGSGWEPIGTNGSEFRGYYNGNGYIISNLFIDRGSRDFTGLFGSTFDGEIKDLGLTNVDVTGSNYTGALVGLCYGTIIRCFTSGSVAGDTYVGGMSGATENYQGSPGQVTNSYSNAAVTANSSGGGFVGRMISGTITNCFSTGSVNTGGGFVGLRSAGTVSDSFWDTQTSGQASSAGSETGKTTSQLKSRSTFASVGWDLNNVWDIIGQNGEHYPKLQSTRMITIDNIGNSNFARSEARNIAFKAQSGTIAAMFEYVDSSHVEIPVDGRTIGEYWEIENVTGNTKIRLYYHPDSTNGFTGTPTIYHYNGSDWEPLPTEAEGTDGSLRYVETTNFRNSFSPVTVGDDASPLPVELTYFEGTATEESVLLEWQTATEVNNYGFEVQKSEVSNQNSEESWEAIGFVQGHGTTNSPKSYLFTDPLNLDLNPNLTRIDYRLKQIDNDGTFTYSKVVTVDLTTITSVDDEVAYEFALEQNFPNPFNPSTTISFIVPSVIASEAKQSINTTLRVYDILGREVATLVNQNLQPGNHEVQFDASSLSSGMYFYRIDVGNKFTSIKKMLMVK